jgi:long-subunit acyl-CoA synthetase (AMP-forming)
MQIEDNVLLAAIKRHHPHNIALHDSEQTLTYAALNAEITQQINAWNTLDHDSTQRLALAMENCPAWIVLDLAAMQCGMPHVPLPLFFSPAQWLHAMCDAGVTLLITDQAQAFAELLQGKIACSSAFTLLGKPLTQFVLRDVAAAPLPDNTSKITYTSGTTGNPKGICLSNENMLNVVRSIVEATQIKSSDVHLSVLPLATLLENVAGVYASLLAGASCVLLPNAQIGLNGASGLNVQQLFSTLKSTHANTAIFTPELLHALVMLLEKTPATLPDLRFLAIGGASVSPALLRRAQACQLPVFEGYGLSECASVVALNVTGNHKPGAVGKPLPHIQVCFTDTQEIVIHGNTYLGYVGQIQQPEQFVATGDIGHLDDEGYLVINGRKKNIFITSFGRNVSPEWVERELKISPHIAQAALYGEARPWNVAVIVPRQHADDTAIGAAIASVNQQLPDYAQVKHWVRADAPFTPQNQQLTANGRNRRDVIWQHYQEKINALYEGTSA